MTKENSSPHKDEIVINFDLNSDDTFISLENNYRFVDHPDDKNADYRCVELLHGDFAGLVYRYGRFKLASRDNPDKTRTIQYEYDIIKIPKNIQGVEYPPEKEKEFSDLLATILIDIVNKWAEENKEETILVKDEDVENRANNTENIIARRAVYSTGDPLFKE